MKLYFAAIRDSKNMTLQDMIELKKKEMGIDIRLEDAENEVFEYMVKNEILYAAKYEFMEINANSIKLIESFSKGYTFAEDLLNKPIDRDFALTVSRISELMYYCGNNLDDRDFAFFNIICSENARFCQKLKEGLNYGKKALRIIKNKFRLGDFYILYHRIAIIYHKNKNKNKAAKIIKECYEWNMENRPSHREALEIMFDYASDVDEMEDHKKAIPLYEECIEFSSKMYGIEHPNTLIARRNYALCMIDLGMPKGIIELEKVYILQKLAIGWNIKTVEVLNVLLQCDEKLEYMDEYVKMCKETNYAKPKFAKKHTVLTMNTKGIDAAKELALWYIIN